jgi:hypothetical protein
MSHSIVVERMDGVLAVWVTFLYLCLIQHVLQWGRFVCEKVVGC